MKAPILKTNPNKIKTERELKINNHKVDHVLNEDFIGTQGKGLPL